MKNRGGPTLVIRCAAIGGAFATGLLAGPGSDPAAAAAPAAVGNACGAFGAAALASLSVVDGTFPDISPPDLAISVIKLSGLPAACEGGTATVTLSGNPTGDPSLPATLVLAIADSSLDPCTHVAVSPAPAISAGTVTLALCAAGGPSGYADLRELTHMAVTADGAAVPVVPVVTGGGGGPSLPTGPTSPPAPGPTSGSGGGTATVAPPAATGVSGPTSTPTGGKASPPPTVAGETLSPVPAPHPTAGLLAFTGANVARLTLAGLLGVILGLFVRRVSRRR